MITRREMIASSAAIVAGGNGLLSVEMTRGAQSSSAPHRHDDSTGEELPYTPVVTPNGSTLPWKLVDGVKVFHLVAEPVQREFAPGMVVHCWGYNGQTPGPTIEAVEGDRVRFYVTNKLPEPTSVHWHGVLLPNGMDGVSGLNQPPIRPSETFKYEFTLRQHGTHMYHPHFDEMTQLGLGMMGLFIIHPRQRPSPPIDRDFALILSEWAIEAGTSRPNPQEMTDFNIITFNGRVFPGTEPLVVRLGERVRIRIGNLSAMSHHPIHLHGYQFRITATDGGPIPESAQWPETTVLVPVGSTRDIEFVANEPGDWALHCHMTHHIMNQMGHQFPNMIGVRTDGLDQTVQRLLPEYMTMGASGMTMTHEMKQPRNTIAMVGGAGPYSKIDMGGMFTILKVYPDIDSYQDPGWYRQPDGTRAAAVDWREVEANAPVYGQPPVAPVPHGNHAEH